MAEAGGWDGGHRAVDAGTGGLPRKRQRASLHSQRIAHDLFHSLFERAYGFRIGGSLRSSQYMPRVLTASEKFSNSTGFTM